MRAQHLLALSFVCLGCSAQTLEAQPPAVPAPVSPGVTLSQREAAHDEAETVRTRPTLAKEIVGTTRETRGSSMLGFTEASADASGKGDLPLRGTSPGGGDGVAHLSLGTSLPAGSDRALASNDDDLLVGRKAASSPFASVVGASTRMPPPDVVRRVVHTRWSMYQACYQAAAMTNPTLRGAVNVRFVIARDGTVTAASDAGDSIADRAVTTCVVNAFPGLRFPPPGGDGEVAVSYSLHFSPAE